MKSLDAYLTEYAASHRNPVNISIHNICVPLIMWSLLGFLHNFTLGYPGLRVSYILVLLALVFYASFRRPLMLIAMGVVTFVMIASFAFIPELLWVSAAVFVLAWLGQFYGHKVEGKKPSFLKDLLFLLIGPVWVLSKAAPTLVRPPNAI